MTLVPWVDAEDPVNNSQWKLVEMGRMDVGCVFAGFSVWKKALKKNRPETQSCFCLGRVSSWGRKIQANKQRVRGSVNAMIAT